MGQLTIASSSSLPMIKPSRVTAKDIAEMAPLGHVASRQYMATTNNNSSITVETTEGDKVTLNYQASTTKKNYLREAGTEIPGLEKSLATHKELAVTVAGELSELEKAEISAFKEDVSKALDSYFEKDPNIRGDHITLDISKFQALSKYFMAVDSSSATSWATEMVVAVPRPILNTVDIESQQKTNLTDSSNRISTLTVSKDQTTTKQNSPLQFDYSVSRMQRQSVIVTAQNTHSLQRGEILVQQKAYDKQGKAAQIARNHNFQKMDLPVFSELGTTTQEIFAQQSLFFKDKSTAQQLNILEKNFLDLIDHLSPKRERTAEQSSITISV